MDSEKNQNSEDLQEESKNKINVLDEKTETLEEKNNLHFSDRIFISPRA